MSWVRVPPEAADFSQKKKQKTKQKKSFPQVSLNCVVFLCVCLEGVLKFVYHVYITHKVCKLGCFHMLVQYM